MAALGDLERDWLALSLVPQLGAQTLRRLVEAYGGAAAALDAGAPDLVRRANLPDRIAHRIAGARETAALRMELRLVAEHGVSVLCLESPAYPEALRESGAPPPVLYVRGDPEVFRGFMVAFVGSRSCSNYGRTHTRRLVEELARATPNLVVVSGLARGVDTAAHRAALDCGARTVAVVAGGLTQTYPPENEGLAAEIAKNGAVVTEFAMPLRPLARNFPIRNRVISGLSQGVVVTEAGARSGARITAAFALQQNREVFALPGPVDSSASVGCHELIARQHAKLVTKGADILEELNPGTLALQAEFQFEVRDPTPLRLADYSEPHALTLRALERGPMGVDEVLDATGLTVNQIHGTLLELELMGVLRALPGSRYQLEGQYRLVE